MGEPASTRHGVPASALWFDRAESWTHVLERKCFRTYFRSNLIRELEFNHYELGFLSWGEFIWAIRAKPKGIPIQQFLGLREFQTQGISNNGHYGLCLPVWEQLLVKIWTDALQNYISSCSAEHHFATKKPKYTCRKGEGSA